MQTFQKVSDSTSVKNNPVIGKTNREIAEWAVDNVLYEMVFVPPPVPPEDILKVRVMKKELRDKLENDFWMRQDIQIWMEKKSEVDATNNSNFYWLNWYKANLDYKDTPRMSKISRFILEWTDRFDKCEEKLFRTYWPNFEKEDA